MSVNNWREMPNYSAIGGNGHWAGNQPAANIGVFQASAYANWLTSGNPDVGLYDINWAGDVGNSNAGGWNTAPVARGSSAMDALVSTYGIVYAIPTEDEWYKAAYFRLEGPGSGEYYEALANPPSTRRLTACVSRGFVN